MIGETPRIKTVNVRCFLLTFVREVNWRELIWKQGYNLKLFFSLQSSHRSWPPYWWQRQSIQIQPDPCSCAPTRQIFRRLENLHPRRYHHIFNQFYTRFQLRQLLAPIRLIESHQKDTISSRTILYRAGATLCWEIPVYRKTVFYARQSPCCRHGQSVVRSYQKTCWDVETSRGWDLCGWNGWRGWNGLVICHGDRSLSCIQQIKTGS